MPEDCGVLLDGDEGEIRRAWVGIPVVDEDEDQGGESDLCE
jgi:hypothetical protein